MTRKHGFSSLPATVGVMAALLGTKSILLVQAALARESGGVAATSSATEAGPATPASAAAIAPGSGAKASAHAATPGSSGAGANAGADLGAQPAEDPSSAHIAPPPAAPKPPPDWSLLQDLRARRQTLDAQSTALDAREAALDAAQHLLEEKRASLQARADSLDRADAVRKAERDASFAGLVKLYEAMRPAQAAAIFDGLDLRILLPLLDRMNARKAALVMGAMDPDRARLATQALARYRLGEAPDPGAAPGSLATAASRG